MNASLAYTLPATGSYQELIAQRARELWQIRGRPEGQDNVIWLDAEQDLLRRRLIPRSAAGGEPQNPAGHI
jgi:hypothetical protein